jgi:hypothetical protein
MVGSGSAWLGLFCQQKFEIHGMLLVMDGLKLSQLV